MQISMANHKLYTKSIKNNVKKHLTFELKVRRWFIHFYSGILLDINRDIL